MTKFYEFKVLLFINEFMGKYQVQLECPTHGGIDYTIKTYDFKTLEEAEKYAEEKAEYYKCDLEVYNG